MVDDITSKGRSSASEDSGFRKRYFSNLSWTREDADERDQSKASGAGASLLSRIQPATSSLLDRIGPIHDVSLTRLSEPLMVDAIKPADKPDEPRRQREVGPSMSPTPANTELAELLIASALAQGRKASISHSTSPPEERKSPASESAVSELLANASGDEKEERNSELQSKNASHEKDINIHSPTVSQAELIELAKQLLVPVIAQNARLRDPGADEETIKSRVMSLITKEHCVEFLQLAKDVREQMREKARQTPPEVGTTAEKGDGVSGLSSSVDPIAETGNQIIQGRQDEVSGANSVAGAAVDPVRNVDVPARSNPSAAFPSIKSPPTAPRAMRIAQSISRSLPTSSSTVSPRKEEPSSPIISRSAPPSTSGRAANINMGTVPVEVASQRQSSIETQDRAVVVQSPSSFVQRSPGPAEIREPSVFVEHSKSGSPHSADVQKSGSPTVVDHDDAHESVMNGVATAMPPESAESKPPSAGLIDSELSIHKTMPPQENVGPLKIEDTADNPSSMMVDMPIDMSPPTADASPMLVDAPLETATDALQERPQGSLSAAAPLNEQPMEVEPAGSTTADHPAEDKAQLQPFQAVVNALEPSTILQTQLEDEVAPPRLPNILYVTVGNDAPDVSEVTFEADIGLAAAARRWCERHATGYNPSTTYASVFLLCLPAEQVKASRQDLDLEASASAEQVANTLWSIPTKWPPVGKLIVEMNGGTLSHKTWLPPQLGPKDGPLDVTACIQPGKNTAQFIQLADTSDYMFVFLARNPLERDRKWTSLVQARGNSWTASTGMAKSVNPTVQVC